jgi:hypothetical protein
MLEDADTPGPPVPSSEPNLRRKDLEERWPLAAWKIVYASKPFPCHLCLIVLLRVQWGELHVPTAEQLLQDR